jgi:Iap family predicted aminopeptidase
MISGWLREMGLKPRKESFDVDVFSLGEAHLEVTAPYKKRYRAWPVGYTSATPAGGLKGELAYVDNPVPAVLSKMKGKVVLLEGRLRQSAYKALRKSGAKAFIYISGPDRLVYGKLSYMFAKKFGRMPGVTISYEDGLEIMKKGASRVRLVSRAATRKAKSQNVIAQINGTRSPEEIIAITAHYDSVLWSPGATDNAAGSALALMLAKEFAKKPPARTLRFIWCGCEEIGLVGSFDYVGRHSREMEKVKLLLNLDVGGTIIGRVRGLVCGDKKLAGYVEVLGREFGAFSEAGRDVYSSDCTPFAEFGVQSVNLLRGGGGTTYIHTSGDSLEHCGPVAFDSIGELAVEFLRRLGDAVEFPFKRGLPEDIRKKLKEYITERSGRKYRYRGDSDAQ